MGMRAEHTMLRCSAVVFRGETVLLVHRTADGADDWVLPGGTPEDGESMAECAVRETREESGLDVEALDVAFVLETTPPDSPDRTVDLVFSTVPNASFGALRTAEPGREPVFVPLDRADTLDLRPPIAGRLLKLCRTLASAPGPGPGPGASAGAPFPTAGAPYVDNLWRPQSG
jgi:8-oxo-dGTP pyrophosphatase MutT (NUDIX family)